MSKPLRVLIVEDNEDDAILLVRELRRGGYAPVVTRVEDAASMREALQQQPWDIVCSDWSMPTFSAPQALELLKATGVYLPFIIVSGTVGEETAVEALRAGAQDFLVKDKLTRLNTVVEREVQEAARRTERRRMQEQLLLSERMASVGTLAAGVAHEINNPLAAVMANLDYALQEVARVLPSTPLEHLQEPLADARDCAIRIRDIVRDIKLFSRVDDEQRGPVALAAVIDSSLRMAWNEIRHRARLVKEYGNTPMAYANEARLGQVILNLVVNAAQAIPEGYVDKNVIRVVTGMETDERIFFEIHDTGPGIPKENLSRIYDPFFTTKEVGVGTGLGLAICYRIVSALNGHISVESQVGRGTMFRVVLPSTGHLETPKLSSPPPPSVRPGRILIIDDEAMLAKSLRRHLSRFHDATAMTSGRAALALLAAGETFDAILCDVMMPDMTGMDVYEQLTRCAPDLAKRIIFVTGGAFTPRARAFLDRVPSPRIDKPIDVPNLLAIIAGLMKRA